MQRDLAGDALSIWRAGVDAVRSERLVGDVITRDDDRLTVCGRVFDLQRLERIAVVGAGKAGAGMAAAVEAALGPELTDRKVLGWVNVPEDCVRSLRRVQLHGARPAAVNEPTPAGVAGSRRILEIVSSLGPRDLCLVLISGGGSALLPAPIPEITLEDKQHVTRFLMRSGATINQLNAVRRQLSQIKGGGLARAIRAGATVTLVISDVVGDPLDVIASGPTVARTGSPAEALAILDRFEGHPPRVPGSVRDALAHAAARDDAAGTAPLPAGLSNHIIGNNATAVAAALAAAGRLGYRAESLGSEQQGEADAAGRELAAACLVRRSTLRAQDAPLCLVSGGEPVVRLSGNGPPGLGGRNQQLVLAAAQTLWDDGASGLALLSGGTDGEDGPTDAAGAFADAEIIRRARAAGLDPADFLARHDAYHFFEPIGGLIRTGPTHTNVMDLRVALIDHPLEEAASCHTD